MKLPSARNSLIFRLQLAISLVFVFFIGTTGLVLDNAFKRSLDASTETEMRLKLLPVLTSGEHREGKLYLPEQLGSEEFDNPSSHLYAIATHNQKIIWRSRSALLQENWINIDCCKLGETHWFKQSGDTPVFVFQKGVAWADDDDGQEYPYTISIIQKTTKYLAVLTTFRQQLWGWLTGMAMSLLFAQYFVMRWGLSPIKRAAIEVEAVKAGQKAKLEGEYPNEMLALTSNINALIEHEYQLKHRYRNTLADLAHSLKTPLAILRGAIHGASNESEIAEPVERIDQIVQHQLSRAVFVGKRSKVDTVDACRCVDRIVRAMNKVYADKTIECDWISATANVEFYGNESDLMEVAGNVIDNAFKYGLSRIDVHIDSVVSAIDETPRCRIVVEDDGPGIPDNKRNDILKRGLRLDTQQTGQGIGLSVVLDIVDQYEGQIDLNRSKHGGLRVTIEM